MLLVFFRRTKQPRQWVEDSEEDGVNDEEDDKEDEDEEDEEEEEKPPSDGEDPVERVSCRCAAFG